MGSLISAGGVAGACFWLPIYPVRDCPLIDEPLHAPHILHFHVNFHVSVGMY